MCWHLSRQEIDVNPPLIHKRENVENSHNVQTISFYADDLDFNTRRETRGR